MKDFKNPIIIFEEDEDDNNSAEEETNNTSDDSTTTNEESSSTNLEDVEPEPEVSTNDSEPASNLNNRIQPVKLHKVREVSDCFPIILI